MWDYDDEDLEQEPVTSGEWMCMIILGIALIAFAAWS